MSMFISKSNCHGVRPAHISAMRHNLRPEIVSELLHDRSVPRIVIAPYGYGKSSLAWEYAQVMFEFKHVFWVNCTSPCFLRDLDANDIIESVFTGDPEADLVVFEDVPPLETERAEAFAGVLDELSGTGCESLVTCTPASNTFSLLLQDKMILKPRDLLLSDDELEVESARGNIADEDFASFPDTMRAACMVWGRKDVSDAVKCIGKEELPGDLKLCLFAALLIGRGSFADVSCLLPEKRVEEDFGLLSDAYPLLGVNMSDRTFETAPVKMEKIRKSASFKNDELEGIYGEISKSADHGCRHSVMYAIAENLLASGNFRRAVDVLLLFATKETGEIFLENKANEFLSAGMFGEYIRLYSSLQRLRKKFKDAIRAGAAWSALNLGDNAFAEKECRRILLSSAANREVRLEAVCIASRLKRAFSPEDIRGMLVSTRLMDITMKGSPFVDWEILSTLVEASLENRLAFDEVWRSLASLAENPSSQSAAYYAFVLAASWVLDEELELAKEDKGGFLPEESADLASRLSGLLLRLDGANFPWPLVEGVRVLCRCRRFFPYEDRFEIKSEWVEVANNYNMLLTSQRTAYKRLSARCVKEARNSSSSNPYLPSTRDENVGLSTRGSTPTLIITLFGGLDVRIGEEELEPMAVVGGKVRVALAILALHRGREVSREKIGMDLWPGSDSISQRNNFYSVWSNLKKSLTIDGACPYLLKSQTGYKLDYRYVKTDLEDFDEFCKMLSFDQIDMNIWEDLYEKAAHKYDVDLLETFVDNSYIDFMRRKYRSQLVDALVNASFTLNEMGESRGAIWFAKDAIRRDLVNGASYIALMEAQIAANQTGSAIETYLECRRNFQEILGIDPPQRVVELYRSIIESEEYL